MEVKKSVSISSQLDAIYSSDEDENERSVSLNIHEKGVVGICAMEVKVNSQPMQYIIKEITHLGWKVNVFSEETLMKDPIEKWPKVDCFIGFISPGYPLQKVINYVNLNPTMYCLNSLESQRLLLDRRKTYEILKRNCIPVVEHLFVSRDADPPSVVEEFTDYIIVDGKKLEKPFVEKPVDAEDHNIHVYFHSKDGGGSVRLFRKVGNKSSQRYPNENKIRREGSFIYEKFLSLQNSLDVKCYSVGTEYVYGESRKSPVIDGIVERDENGKEIRYQVTLSTEEKLIAYRIVKAFDQRICGFDILRDAKTEKVFVCDVNGWSFVKGNYLFYDSCAKILDQLFSESLIQKGLPYVELDKTKTLRGVIGIFRHADRTPKQKIKLNSKHPKLIGLCHGMPKKANKIRSLIHLDRLKQFLEVFNEIYPEEESLQKHPYLKDVLNGTLGAFKIQMKPQEAESTSKEIIKIRLIIKWGGNLTHAGLKQAFNLGRDLWRILPRDPEQQQQFKKNLTVHTNQEHRVYQTGSELGKGYLGLDEKDEFPEEQIRHNSEMSDILAEIEPGKKLIEKMKEKIFALMHQNEIKEKDLPGIQKVGRPLQTFQKILELIGILEQQQSELSDPVELCGHESIHFFKDRWSRLKSAFYVSPDQFNLTKVPDIFDYIHYDFVHNQEFLQGHDLYPLYKKAEYAGRFIISSEYGVSSSDKLRIGSLIATPLLNRILQDINGMTSKAEPKTQFYVSSESHLHALRNTLLHSTSSTFHHLVEPIELNYLTHIIFRLIEDHTAKRASEKFFLEVLFSGGTSKNPFTHTVDHVQPLRARISINNRLLLEDLNSIFSECNTIYTSRKN